MAVDITIPEPESPRFAVTPENRAAGEALLARVVEATGGAEAIDGIDSIATSAEMVAITPQGEMTLNLKLVAT